MSNPYAVESPPAGDLAMAVALESGRAVVELSGEVDLQTAPAMGALLRSLVDEGHELLVLDFAELTFMDASGLRVIVDIAGQLTRSARELRVRSVPAMTQRILDLTGVSGLVGLDHLEPVDDGSGSSDVVAPSDGADPEVGEPVAEALAAREVIAQAQGIFMARRAMSAEEAAAAIHRSAREREVSVLAEAADIVDTAENTLPAKVSGPSDA